MECCAATGLERVILKQDKGSEVVVIVVMVVAVVLAPAAAVALVAVVVAVAVAVVVVAVAVVVSNVTEVTSSCETDLPSSQVM